MTYYEWGDKEIHLVTEDEPAWLNQQFRVCHRIRNRWEHDLHEKRQKEAEQGRGKAGATAKTGSSREIEDTGKKAPRLKGSRLKRPSSGRRGR